MCAGIRSILVAAPFMMIQLAGVAPAAAEPASLTKAFIRDVSRGKIALRSLVDPRRGLVDLAYVVGECDDDGVCARRARRLCGSALDRRLAELARALPERLRNAEGDGFSCRNAPTPSCTLAIAGEYASTWELSFRADGERLVLEQLLERNSAYRKLGAERRYLAKAMAKLPSTCAEAAAAPTDCTDWRSPVEQAHPEAIVAEPTAPVVECTFDREVRCVPPSPVRSAWQMVPFTQCPRETERWGARGVGPAERPRFSRKETRARRLGKPSCDPTPGEGECCYVQFTSMACD